MYEKILALFAFALFAIFLAILGIWVESISLKIVLIITGLMCAYDFWLDVYSSRANSKSSNGH